MTRILSMARKEILQIKRDRRMLPLIFIAPLVQVILFGYVATIDVRAIPFGVHDPNPTRATRELIARLTESGCFDLYGRAARSADLDRWLDEGRISVGLALPPDYTRRMEAGKTATVAVLLDGTDSNSATIAQSYLVSNLQQYSSQLALARQARSGRGGLQTPIDLRCRVWYNPELRAANFMVPAVIAMILMVTTMMLTALSIVKERERGTLEQLMVTVIKPWELMVGKLLPFPVLGMLEVLLVTMLGVLWFKVPVQGSLPLLFALAAVFLLSTLGMGLLISTFCRTQQQAMLAAMFVLIPNMLLSGFIVPVANMPRPIQALSLLIPGRYFMEIVRGIFLKGAGLAILWPQAAILAVMGLAALAVSSLRFRKRLT